MDKPKKYEERLMEALAFDDDDLAANQSGVLSPRQLARLKKTRLGSVSAIAFVMIVGIALLALVLGAISIADLATEAVLLPLALAVTIAAISGYYWRRAVRILTDLREDRVAEVEGRVDLSVAGGQNSVYIARVGKLRFPLKQKQFLAFKNGDPYCLYYAPRSKTLLSAAWLRENDDNLIELSDEVASAGSEEAPSVETPDYKNSVAH